MIWQNQEKNTRMPSWYYEKRELRSTPSIQEGLTYEQETLYRREGARFILQVGNKMGLRYETMATGVVYFHRFYMFHTFQEFPRHVTACCCLFLAGKVEETPKKCRDIIKTAKSLIDEQTWAEFGIDPKEEVMTLERILLQTIKFDFIVEHPYTYLLKYAKCLKGDKKKLQNMVQMAWTFVNDSLCTTLSLQWEPEIIAIALMYLAGKLSKFDVVDWVGRTPKHQRWWDMYVEGISMELLEDVCHQVLDLYSPNKSEAAGWSGSGAEPLTNPARNLDTPTTAATGSGIISSVVSGGGSSSGSGGSGGNIGSGVGGSGGGGSSGGSGGSGSASGGGGSSSGSGGGSSGGGGSTGPPPSKKAKLEESKPIKSSPAKSETTSQQQPYQYSYSVYPVVNPQQSPSAPPPRYPYSYSGSQAQPPGFPPPAASAQAPPPIQGANPSSYQSAIPTHYSQSATPNPQQPTTQAPPHYSTQPPPPSSHYTTASHHHPPPYPPPSSSTSHHYPPPSGHYGPPPPHGNAPPPPPSSFYPPHTPSSAPPSYPPPSGPPSYPPPNPYPHSNSRQYYPPSS
ncbi:cyclin K isoform X2 [Oratosquilla oratoria]